MKIKCLVVDDEPIAIEIIASYIRAIDELHFTGSCNNAIEAFNFLQREQVDLIFLDIKMPQLSGLDFLKSLQTIPKVIIITAYPEHALEGYELDVVDYILKPVSYQRFLKAVNKASDLLHLKKGIVQAAPADDIAASFIYLKQDKKMIKVLLNDILYFEGLGNYVKAVTNSKEITTYQTLSFLEEQLANSGFLRVHKSFIISLNKVDAYTNDSIEIKKKEIPIGGSYKLNLFKHIRTNKI